MTTNFTSREHVADIIIVGAGPAGSTLAARLARSGLQVLIVDNMPFAAPYIGEFLPPKARAMLHRSALLAPGWEAPHRSALAFDSTWGSAQVRSRDYLFDPRGHALVLDRQRFNRQLLDAAIGQGTKLLPQSRARRAAQTDGIWTVHLESNSSHKEVHGLFLVDCSGRIGTPLAGITAKRRRIDRMICLGARIGGYRGDAAPSIESYAHGWAYSVAVGTDELMVNICTDRRAQPYGPSTGAAEFFLNELAQCPIAASRVYATRPAPTTVTFFATDAASTLTRPAAGPGWCLAGDRAQSMDPLSSSGIESALCHAELIANAALRAATMRNIDMPEYSTWLDTNYDAYLNTRRRFYGTETRWPCSFWRSRSAHLSLRTASMDVECYD